jgi:hypothetical protein
MRTIAVDSELLVLLIVGTASRSYISKHKRLGAYSAADFDLLIELLSEYSDVIVMPNKLTEASNLLGQVSEPIRTRIFETFRAFIGVSTEESLGSKAVSGHDQFVRLGLTDAALMTATREQHVLLTADFDLYWASARAEQAVINFNHYREARGLV